MPTINPNIQHIEELDKLMLTPTDVAPVLGCKPYAINVQAQEDPSRLGFAVCVIGRRIKIPKAAFLAWYHGREESK